MGTGIVAVIPLVITPSGRGWKRDVELEYFSPRLSDCYYYDEENRNYTIRHTVLLDNYRAFLAEFHDCIGEPGEMEEPPELDSYEAFKEYFNGNARNMKAPFIYEHQGMLSILGGACPEYWLFYSGSHKAYLEVYKTLTHFERTLAKAMKNPLVHAVKFGIFG